MGWRTICIDDASRLNYKLNSIGVLQKDEIIWICLDEISIIIIETLMCNVSTRLLLEIAKKGITLILCDDSHMPLANLTSIYDNQRTAKYNRLQIEWDKNTKQIVWRRIVKQKILLQIVSLCKNNKEDKVPLLKQYMEDVQEGDITNREGLAAKVYFHELFGIDFTRERHAEDIINSSLNYMYQVIRAKIAQEIISHGYLPTLGIFHCSEYNYFGLADDLIEVYRPIIDMNVIKVINENEFTFMSSSCKEKLIGILYSLVMINNKSFKLIDSIQIYVISVLESLNLGKPNIITFPCINDDA